MIEVIKFRVGRYKIPVNSCKSDGRLFLDFPFNRDLMDEIRCFAGAQYHGYKDAPNRDVALSIFKHDKLWSFPLCPRNDFQLLYLRGGNPFGRWDLKPDLEIKYDRPLRSHQKVMTGLGLAMHFQVWGAEMGTGKTLSAIEVMERSGFDDWYYCGPKSALRAVDSI